eukprot:TRINITY_DN69955_c0_g1_i1.p1 TRINITY_DN69955_c0_g1~~TRINITY_DN69955_c0_g1_i1.p1  ORF type:complete len:175 (-),score=27.43 TRINITY_DN69955_c0_g1_i1:85-609(-)
MERASSSTDLSRFTGGRSIDSSYVSQFLPFVGAPDHSRLMAKHPLSSVRRGCSMPDISMKDVWEKRKAGNFVLQNSTSESYQSHCEAAGPTAVEFSSHDTITRTRNKHTRSELAPSDKFKFGKVSSSAIGWHAASEHGKDFLRHPAHGIAESGVTKNYSNMKATNMEACLRLCV